MFWKSYFFALTISSLYFYGLDAERLNQVTELRTSGTSLELLGDVSRGGGVVAYVRGGEGDVVADDICGGYRIFACSFGPVVYFSCVFVISIDDHAAR